MIDLSANLPTRFMSSPCPAMPMTSVPKISGAMMDLIMRRKICESGRKDCAASGNIQPINVPIAMDIRIHLVSEMPRSVDQIVRGGVVVAMGGESDDLLHHTDLSASTKRASDLRASPNNMRVLGR